MNYKSMNETCSECGCFVSEGVARFSFEKYGLPLCIEHQDWIEYMAAQTTFETIRLYFALKKRGVPAQMEKFDGYKHIDIAVPQAKINIEIDGVHHNLNPKQALADLKRSYYSFCKGYFTVRIPNSLIRNHYNLEETADFHVAFMNESLNKNFGRQQVY